MSLIDFFTDHTYLTVTIGTAIIGLLSGALGSYTYVRKESLSADVIAHAALPGTMTAFLVSVLIFQIDGRTLPLLIVGALIFGAGAMWIAHTVVASSRVNIDAAMAIVLSSLFGLGLWLMDHIARNQYPGKGGIKDYLFGNAATMTRSDLYTLGVVAVIVALMVTLLWKEFLVQSFDPNFARTLGFKASVLDGLMFATITLAIVVGTKAVGLVLMVAFIITPPVIARQLVNTFGALMGLAAFIGAFSGVLGSYISVNLGKVPTGPVIVILLFVEFVIVLFCAPRRSIIRMLWARRETRRLAQAAEKEGVR